MALFSSNAAPAIPDGEVSASATGEDDELLRQLKTWFRGDREFSEKWRADAREDFDFVAGEQWSDADKQYLKDLMRPVITFNRVQPIISSVSGHQMGNRQEVRFLPREA